MAAEFSRIVSKWDKHTAFQNKFIFYSLTYIYVKPQKYFLRCLSSSFVAQGERLFVHWTQIIILVPYELPCQVLSFF